MRCSWIIWLLATLLSGAAYGQHPCASDKSFSTFTSAICTVREATFSYSERINSEQSSWLRLAEYFGCDGGKGFLIITTDDKEYIHYNVPINVWEAFKAASSRGGFYNQAIKGQYRLELIP